MTGRRPAWLTAVVLLAAFAALLWNASSYLPFLADDALISLRYAQRLLHGHGLTWTAGPRVEGYSNLLWVLLCAGLGAAGIDLIQAARILGVGCSALAIVALVAAHRPARVADVTPALAGGLLVALAGPVAAWSVGGLEQPLLAGLIAWALTLCYPLLDQPSSGHGVASMAPGRGVARTAPEPGAGWLAPGALLALACWARPDGALFTAAACAGLIAARSPSRATLALCARLAFLPALAVAAQLAFRLGYYGEWVPNAALAKLALTPHRLREGALYLGTGMLWLAPLALGVAALGPAIARDPPAFRRARFLAVPLIAWMLYVVAIGGDIFPARRFLVALVVLGALLIAEGLAALVRRGRAGLAAGAALLLVVALALLQRADPENARARAERWEWDGEVVGRLLGTSFGERNALLAADPAGTLPYFSGLPAIDMLGLNDRFLAHHPPADLGRGWIGHELGNGRYILEREPDLVVFCGPGGSRRPCFRSGIELMLDPRFQERYRLVEFEGEQPYAFRSRIWVRKEGGRVGIERSADRVSVPGHLLHGEPGQSVARLDGGNRIGLALAPRAIAGWPNLELGPGRWRLSCESSGGPPRSGIRLAGGRWTMSEPGGSAELAIVSAATVDLSVVAPLDPTHVRRLVLERIAE